MALAARYAQAGDYHIAYTVTGDGPFDLVWVPTWIHQVEHAWNEPSLAAVYDRIGEFARLITFDRRGSGLSDPMVGAPTLEEQMDDILAVMDAAGSERAAVLGMLEGGPLAATFAATHPERVGALVLYSSWARMTYAPDYDWAQKPEEREVNMAAAADRWGEGLIAGQLSPDRFQTDPEFQDWAARLERLAASPGTIHKIFKLIGEFDVRDVLPTIRVPTLVMYRSHPEFLDERHSRYLAEHIPGARYVELEPGPTLFELGEVDPLVDEIEEFLTGTRQRRDADRMLATVLFTDICGSTERAAELGDARWRRVLEQHDTVIRRTLDLHRGKEIKRTGDGFLATFDGPARAIRAASAIAQSVRGLGIEVRAGLHTGECEVMNGDLGGLAVHIGSRVMSYADPGEVLVSSTVKDLVVGSGIDFEDRGQRELRGVPGEWRLWAVS